MKRTFVITLSAILVTLLCVTGVCFADSWPEYSITQASVSFTSDGFTLTASGADDGYIVFQNCSYANASVSWELNEAITSNSKYSFTWPVTDSAITVSFSDVSDSSREGTNRIFFNPNETSGYYNFDISTTNPSWNSGQVRFYVPASRSVTYTFGGFDFNGNTIVSGVVSDYLDFAIQPGYAVVIEGDFDILERSYYINNSWNFTSNSNRRVNGSIEKKLSSSYIVDGFSPDRANDPNALIQWEALNPNLLGAASNYEFYDSTPISIDGLGWSYIICYPQQYGFGNANTRQLYTNSVDMVCHLLVNYSTRPTVRFVAIESLSDFNSYGDFYTYSVFRPAVADVDGSASEGSGGTVITPETPLPSGGGNAGQPPVDEDSSLLGTISRFVNDIKRLLTSAVDAINTLVSQGSSFMQSVGTMFTWLPAPLVTLLIAAFTVLVVMGVLKTLWR